MTALHLVSPLPLPGVPGDRVGLVVRVDFRPGLTILSAMEALLHLKQKTLMNKLPLQETALATAHACLR